MFIKNVTARVGDHVYLEHKTGDEFDLALSFQPHNIKFGDQVVLSQTIKGVVFLTHIVMLLETEVTALANPKHDKKIKVRVLANAEKNLPFNEVLPEVKYSGIVHGKVVNLLKIDSIGKEDYPQRVQDILSNFSPYMI